MANSAANKLQGVLLIFKALVSGFSVHSLVLIKAIAGTFPSVYSPLHDSSAGTLTGNGPKPCSRLE